MTGHTDGEPCLCCRRMRKFMRSTPKQKRQTLPNRSQVSRSTLPRKKLYRSHSMSWAEWWVEESRVQADGEPKMCPYLCLYTYKWNMCIVCVHIYNHHSKTWCKALGTQVLYITDAELLAMHPDLQKTQVDSLQISSATELCSNIKGTTKNSLQDFFRFGPPLPDRAVSRFPGVKSKGTSA